MDHEQWRMARDGQEGAADRSAEGEGSRGAGDEEREEILIRI